MTTVIVMHNNIDQAMKALKKKMQRDGVYREMRDRERFMTNTERRHKQIEMARKRERKARERKLKRETGVSAHPMERQERRR